MYILDFIKSLLCIDKISAIVYMLFNLFITIMLVLLFIPDIVPALAVSIFFMFLGDVTGAGFISVIAATVQDLELYLVNAVKYIWFLFGYSLVFQFHQKREYHADEFTAGLGYGEPLCELLDSFKHSKSSDLILLQLDRSHPSARKRIKNISRIEENISD